ncbi:hypothetical protein N2152v2_000720 [Parachlorella kessleri]
MCLAYLQLCSCQPAVGVTSSTLSDWNDGILTFFGGAPDGMDPNSPSYGTKEGSCGYGLIQKDIYPYFATAALSLSNKFSIAGPLKACGQCFEIQCTDSRPGVCVKDSSGNSASVTAMITDSCPECEADHIDLQANSFAKLAVPAYGRVQMHYRRVNCAPPTDLKVTVDNFGGSGGWIRLSIDDTGGRGSVKQVYVKGSSDGSFGPMVNKWGAMWELGNAPQPPLDFKIELDNGDAVTANDVVKQNGGISGSGKFNIPGAPPGTVQAFSGPSDSSSDNSTSSSSNSTSSGTSPSPPAQEQSSPSPSPSPSSPSPSPSPSSSSQQSSPSPSPAYSPLPTANNLAQDSCTDIPPDGSATCQQRKEWGQCNNSITTSRNFCAATCGRCKPSSSSSGRKLLLRQGL